MGFEQEKSLEPMAVSLPPKPRFFCLLVTFQNLDKGFIQVKAASGKFIFQTLSAFQTEFETVALLSVLEPFN